VGARIRDRQVIFWTGVALVALLVGMGTYGPLFRAFFTVLPGWNLFRDQERAAVLFALAGSVLAGYGLVLIRHSARRSKHLLLAGILIILSFANLW